MTGRLTRFLNLERPRTAEQTPPHGVATKARFEGAEPEIGLEFDMGEQPFLRCPACEADNGKHAEKCFNCGRPLQTEDVRAWNAVFWQARQAQKAVQMSPAPPLLNEETRKLAELLALQVAEREKARMWWWKDEQPYDSTPAAFRLLGLIKDANTRFMVAVCAVVTFLGSGALALSAKGHPRLQIVCTVVAMSILVLFVPNSRRRSRWWDWD